MKYSGFGKITRGLYNFMDGKDPFTREEGSTGKLVFGGITDLATMGTSVFGATLNISLNGLQEAGENSQRLDELGIQSEELGILREVVDIGFSVKQPVKLIDKVETYSNVAQGVMAIDDKIKKEKKEKNQ